MTGTAVYLYGVARDLDPAALGGTPGVSGAAVRGVVAGGLTALVSTVRLDDYGEAALRANLEDLAWLEETARAHHEVVDRAAHAAPTAPVRIATLYRDDARVAEILADQRERFGEVLDGIAGRSEWGVKVYASPPEPAEPAGSDPGGGLEPRAEPLTGSRPPKPGAGAGTAYLRRRQDERRRREDAGRRMAERASALHAELAEHAIASRHHPPQDPRLSGRAGTQIMNAAYLLDDEREAGFLAAARAAAGHLEGVELEVTGPWPPYSFIDADTVSAAPAAGDPAS
ncbi:GvpL/GvpF family gas vesicle protein [Actinomadura graeca]|uniref:GvpL/GvpF family gas vesicle protein n=1 Tax=Actinomadura graeca TaxID=2750812 RepID=A0ABX8QM25_9ACTN|nr:GvpL/GvpF family gas vesicle protein [Actinomadura graeca]QXJ19745.1 GvpL/GvpF family gas vesicle protein [Actinomadura graeca]